MPVAMDTPLSIALSCMNVSPFLSESVCACVSVTSTVLSSTSIWSFVTVMAAFEPLPMEKKHVWPVRSSALPSSSVTVQVIVGVVPLVMDAN